MITTHTSMDQVLVRHPQTPRELNVLEGRTCGPHT